MYDVPRFLGDDVGKTGKVVLAVEGGIAVADAIVGTVSVVSVVKPGQTLYGFLASGDSTVVMVESLIFLSALLVMALTVLFLIDLSADAEISMPEKGNNHG